MKIAQQELHIPAGAVHLAADLAIPERASALILFVHGNGSSRSSPRDRFVALALQARGFATLVVDLLTPEEDAAGFRTAEHRYDVELLAARLVDVTHWLRLHEPVRELRIGYFAANTGAAAALIAAAHHPDEVTAVVCRGGRADLAVEWLPRVRAATLLLVGSDDPPTITINRDALPHLRGDKQLEVVEGAGHLFDEPGTLQEVATRAAEWFAIHFAVEVPA